jgi:hypothetical protein
MRRIAIVVAVALSGLACGGDGAERSATNPAAPTPCPEGTEPVRARDIIGRAPTGYQVVPGDRKAIKAFADQFRQEFGERWRGYDAKVLARRDAVNGTAVVVLNADEETRGSDFLRGAKAAEQASGAKGEDIRVGDEKGRLQQATDGAYIAMAPAGPCAFVLLVADSEALVRRTAALVRSG